MLKVYLGDLMYHTEGVGNKIMPLGIGFVAAYLNSHLKGRVHTHLFKDPNLLLDAVKKERPNVVALSNYPWTRNLSGEMLRFIKGQYPDVITVMGGPNYSDDAEPQTRFLARREFLDFYVYQEGEQAMFNLMVRLMDCGMDVRKAKCAPIPSVHFYDRASRQLIRGANIPRFVDLDVIESPYLTGLFDEFFDDKLQPFVQTTRGCPFTCTFCTEGGDYYTKVRRFSFSRVQAELEYITRRTHKAHSLHISDSNFGMYKEDLDVCRVVRRLQDEHDWPRDIFVSAGKNVTRRIVEACKITRGAFALSLQVESMDPEVLRHIKRQNVSIQTMMDAVDQTQSIARTQRVISAVIVPLPGETHQSHLNSLRSLLDLEINFICPFTLMMLEGTEIASQRSREQYGMVTKYRPVPNYYGSFQGIHAIECEEVCVATNTMSFDEYVNLRGMHFFLGSYQSDDNMLELRKYLKHFGISTFDWLLAMQQSIDSGPESVQKVYGEFLQATREELWDSEEELLDFWNVPDNREKFVNGELGDNVFFKYRAKAVTACARDLLDFGGRIGERMVLARHPTLSPDLVRCELRDVSEYVFLKRSYGITSEEINRVVVQSFKHDFIAWERDRYSRPLSEYEAERHVEIKFFYTEYQRQKLTFAYEQLGKSAQAVGMILRKHNPLFFVRETAYVGGEPPVHTPAFVHPEEFVRPGAA